MSRSVQVRQATKCLVHSAAPPPNYGVDDKLPTHMRWTCQQDTHVRHQCIQELDPAVPSHPDASALLQRIPEGSTEDDTGPFIAR